jgi:ankyrin repeat protein
MALYWAVAQLDHRADDDDYEGVDDGNYGEAVLCWTESGYKAVVQVLLEHKVDVDVKDTDGWTATQQVAEAGYKAAVRLLAAGKTQDGCGSGWLEQC